MGRAGFARHAGAGHWAGVGLGALHAGVGQALRAGAGRRGEGAGRSGNACGRTGGAARALGTRPGRAAGLCTWCTQPVFDPV